MLWNIETLNSLISFTYKPPLLSVPMQEHLSKMVGLNANTVTYLTMLGFSSFLSHVLNVFGGKPLSLLSTPSTVFHSQISKMCLPLNIPNSSLRVFGYACFVLLHLHEHSKLEPRFHLCSFLGYGIEHKGSRCWDPIS